jgi:hypothetical protein
MTSLCRFMAAGLSLAVCSLSSVALEKPVAKVPHQRGIVVEPPKPEFDYVKKEEIVPLGVSVRVSTSS